MTNTETKFSNGLSPAEDERLALLVEEMGEALQVIGKIKRHGYASFDPTDTSLMPPDNRQLLEKELSDVLQAIDLHVTAKDSRAENIERNTIRRWTTVRKYLHHQPDELFAEAKEAEAFVEPQPEPQPPATDEKPRGPMWP